MSDVHLHIRDSAFALGRSYHVPASRAWPERRPWSSFLIHHNFESHHHIFGFRRKLRIIPTNCLFIVVRCKRDIESRKIFHTKTENLRVKSLERTAENLPRGNPTVRSMHIGCAHPMSYDVRMRDPVIRIAKL